MLSVIDQILGLALVGYQKKIGKCNRQFTKCFGVEIIFLRQPDERVP